MVLHFFYAGRCTNLAVCAQSHGVTFTTRDLNDVDAVEADALHQGHVATPETPKIEP